MDHPAMNPAAPDHLPPFIIGPGQSDWLMTRQLIVGPDAATITVIAAVLATIPGLADANRAGVVLALIVGGLYLGGRALSLGVLSTFLSRPILVGFFAGVSLSIITHLLASIPYEKVKYEEPKLGKRQRKADDYAPDRTARNVVPGVF